MKVKTFSWQMATAILVLLIAGGQALAGRLNRATSFVEGVAAAAEVAVDAIADAFVFSGYGSSNFNGDYLEVGTGYLPGDEQPGEMRALVKFTLPTLPAGAVIDSATIKMFQSGGSLAATIEMARNTGAWTETGVTWNTQPGTADPKWTSGTGTYPGWYTHTD